MRRLARVAASLGLIAVLLWLGTYLAGTSRASLLLYRRHFGSAVAHEFAVAMADAGSKPRAVLLAGASSVHEGFVEEVMDEAAPGWSFVNGGTAMGSVFVYEALMELLLEYRVRPFALVIGLHPVVLADREINFDGGAYTDFFDAWHGWRPVAFDDARFRADNERELRWNSLWPGHRLGRQLGRLIRYGLLALHQRLYWGPKLPRQSFETAVDDLLPQPRYYYYQTAPLPGVAEAGTRWFKEHTTEWAAPRHLASLRRTMDNAVRVSPRVAVLLMPEHSLTRELTRPVKEVLLGTLDEYRERGVVILDRSNAMPDDAFLDSIHLHATSRPRFSRDIAPTLAALWPPVD